MPVTSLSPPTWTAIPLPLVQEGQHVARICNACRYCEGFCAVFPAIERRLSFSEKDLNYLANLCHDCGECLDACQYAPPHEFGVDVPRTFAAIRRASYRGYAWPPWFGGLFERSALALLLGAGLAPFLFALVLGMLTGTDVFLAPHAVEDGAFYQVMPHTAMIGLFGAIGFYAAAALLVGLSRCWREMADISRAAPGVGALRQALLDVLTLRYLTDDGDGNGGDGTGGGCVPDGDPTREFRRRWHHCTFYGFLLCFAATSVAAFYHNVLGWVAPYPVLSVPVLLGIMGGAGLLAGPVGLLWLKMRRPPERHDQVQFGMDLVFLVLLFETSLTGFLLLASRESAAMGPLLGVHLGAVAGLFLMLPYGKFVHGLYRACALVCSASETRAGSLAK